MATTFSSGGKNIKDAISYLTHPDPRHKEYEEGERVKMVCSTLTAETHDINGMMDEMALFQGRMVEGKETYTHLNFRVSFDPRDTEKMTNPDGTLNEPLMEQVIKDLADRYLGKDRNYLAVVHGDSECGNLHIHYVSYLKDSNDRILQFSGPRAHAEAVRRQGIADEVCQKYGLHTLEREDGQYRKAQDKVSIKEVYMRKAGKYLFTDDLRNRINNALRTSKIFSDFSRELKKQNVSYRLTGKGISYAFKDETGKDRIVKGGSLGENYTLAHINNIVKGDGNDSGSGSGNNPMEYREYNPSNTIASPVSSDCGLSCASSSPTGGGSSAGITAGDNATKEEREAVAAVNKSMQQVAAQIQRTAQQMVAEQTKQKGLRMRR